MKCFCQGISKNIETRFPFLCIQVTEDKSEVIHCPTEAQIADSFTKAIKTDIIEKLRVELGVTLLKKKLFELR